MSKATLILILIGLCHFSTLECVGQEIDLPSDPFAAPVAYETSDQWAEPTEDQQPWLLRSPFANISWPKVEMPRFQLLPDFSDSQRTHILGQNRASMFEVIATAPARLFARTRQAWNRSLDMFKLGGGSGSRAPREPWLGRLFGSGEPEQEGPRTINEWMSQDRLKP